MPENKPFRKPSNPSAHLQPGQDIMVRKQAAQFPEIGMTLSSYKHNAFSSKGSTPARRSAAPNKTLPPPVTGAVAAAQPKQKRRWWRSITLKRVAISLVLIVFLVGGWLGYKFIYNAHKVFGGNIFSALSATKLKGESTGRVNILLAGNSADDTGHDGAALTDSIMILSIDVKNNKALMLSVPRDLWVDVGDYGHSKINEAYVDGENNGFSQNGYPSGGMGQLEQVIEENFGLNINYYALVNYTAFREAVNAVGGIDVTIASSDPRGLYDPSIDWTTNGPLVKLTNGPHHLTGQQALNLARARGDDYRAYGFAGSDFDRTQHQRDMLIALKSKAASAGVLSNPAKISSLADAIGSNVKTDMNLSEARRLYDLTKNIGANNIQSIGLNKVDGKNLLMNYTSPSGQSALAPAAGVDDFSDIQAYLKRALSTNPVVQENAKIVVLNATETGGLASTERTRLEDKEINVIEIGNSNTTQSKTSIIDLSKGSKTATRSMLTKLYSNNFTTTNPYGALYSDADFIILVGTDRIPTDSSSSNP